VRIRSLWGVGLTVLVTGSLLLGTAIASGRPEVVSTGSPISMHAATGYGIRDCPPDCDAVPSLTFTVPTGMQARALVTFTASTQCLAPGVRPHTCRVIIRIAGTRLHPFYGQARGVRFASSESGGSREGWEAHAFEGHTSLLTPGTYEVSGAANAPGPRTQFLVGVRHLTVEVFQA
jgi:hypothetical protein